LLIPRSHGSLPRPPPLFSLFLCVFNCCAIEERRLGSPEPSSHSSNCITYFRYPHLGFCGFDMYAVSTFIIVCIIKHKDIYDIYNELSL